MIPLKSWCPYFSGKNKQPIWCTMVRLFLCNLEVIGSNCGNNLSPLVGVSWIHLTLSKLHSDGSLIIGLPFYCFAYQSHQVGIFLYLETPGKVIIFSRSPIFVLKHKIAQDHLYDNQLVHQGNRKTFATIFWWSTLKQLNGAHVKLCFYIIVQEFLSFSFSFSINIHLRSYFNCWCYALWETNISECASNCLE